MQAKFKVPNLSDDKAAQDLKETILVAESEAKVDMDFTSNTINIESEASQETFRQIIVAAGYQIQSEM
jgi:copper chaperone